MPVDTHAVLNNSLEMEGPETEATNKKTVWFRFWEIGFHLNVFVAAGQRQLEGHSVRGAVFSTECITD